MEHHTTNESTITSYSRIIANISRGVDAKTTKTLVVADNMPSESTIIKRHREGT